MPVSSAEYIGWVHRSLNRILHERTPVTGSTGGEYRSLVKRFQDEYTKPVTGQVDKRTQDAIIFTNHTDGVYSKWIRESLFKFSNDSSLLNGGGLNDAVRKAIKNFQHSKNIDQDGWVGPNTELALYLVIGKPIPEEAQLPESEMHRIQRLCDRLLQEIEWRDVVFLSGHAALVIPPMLRKLKSFNLDYEFFSDHNAEGYQEGREMVKKGNTPLEGCPTLARVEDVTKNNALNMLKGSLAKDAPPNFPSDFIYKTFKELIREIYNEIDHGLWRTLKGPSLGNLKTGGTYAALMDWTVKKKESDRSILSVWPPFYEKFWPWEQLPQF